MGKRITFRQQAVVALEDFSPMPPRPDEVLVRTISSLISIGTETTVLNRKYGDDTHFAKQFPFPRLQTGNQAIGVVEQCGGEVIALSPGDRVFIRKAHASHWTLPASSCSRVPDTVNNECAIWCGFAKIAYRAVEAAPFRPSGNTLVIGAGPVGQMAARWALASGMNRVVACDLSAKRLGLLPSGVEVLLGSIAENKDALMSLCNHEGFESVIESTGAAAVFQTALSLAAPLGKVVLLGDSGFPAQQSLTPDVMTKGLSIVGAHEAIDRCGLTQLEIDELFFRLVQRGSFDVTALITHSFEPAEYEQAYTLVSDNRAQAVGVIFKWLN